MPASRSVLARALTAVAVLGGLAVAQAPAASAQVVRPAFKAPFVCGQLWFSRTYPGHPSFAIDWNLPGGGEADFGQPVLAGAPGIASVDADSGYGNMVTIDHGNGWRTLYAHLSAISVANGQPVTAETVVGQVGRTGRADGSHLHQEQSLNGVRQAIQLDGVNIVASQSSRGASHASGNCPAPAPKPLSSVAAWGCRFRCTSTKTRTAPETPPPTRRIF
jgi:hypothetical protein